MQNFWHSIVEFVEALTDFLVDRFPSLSRNDSDANLYRYEALNYAGKVRKGKIYAFASTFAVQGVCRKGLFPTSLVLVKKAKPVNLKTDETQGIRFEFSGFDNDCREKTGTIHAASARQAAILLRHRYKLFPAKIERAR